MSEVHEALEYADFRKSAGVFLDESDDCAIILAAEVRRLRSEIDSAREELQSFVAARNEWKQRAEAAEAALKEVQEQPAVAWLCGKDVTTHKEYAEWFMRFTQEDCTQLYARPVPDAPAVAVPAVPDQFCDVTKLIVPQEWRDVITELADDLSIELDMRYQSRSHYPSELRKYENEMQPVYRARALLQSVGEKK